MISAHLASLFLLATDSPGGDAVRQTLAAKSDRWFFWLVASSIVVGIGVILEAPEATVELTRWYVRWRRGKTKNWMTPASYLGLVLVVGGVAGEGVFEFLASKADTELRAHDEQILAQALHDAGDAKDSAKQAALASDRANSSADAAGKKAERARKEADFVFGIADKANESARGALALAGQAKTQVGEVQGNIAKVDEKYAPRHLSKTKRDIFIALLKKSQAKPKDAIAVDFGSDATDGEPYAAEIVAAINDPTTGWKAKMGSVRTPGSAPGIFLLIHDVASAPSWAGELQKAMQSAGLGGEGSLAPELPSGSVVILIARKY